MIERAILWVAHPPILRQRVGGMTVLERQLFTAARAGLKTLFIGAHKPADSELAGLRLPPGVELRWAEGHGGVAACEPPYLGLSTDHLVRVETLRHIASQEYPDSITYEDASSLGVVQVVLRRDEALSRHKQPLPPGSYRRLEAPLDGPATVDWLMQSGPRSGDGFMARHFDRHISLNVSRALLETGVTPNMMTVLSTLIGLSGGALFLSPDGAMQVGGALLVWLHSVLDGCDGELARVRFQESAFGADLDFWGDNLVHLALFTCLGLGFSAAGRPHALALAAVADLAVLASATVAWRRRVARRAVGQSAAGVTDEPAGSGLDNKLARLENSLAQRDFIYLLVFLAFVDRVYEFLWASAVGGALYFAIMLYLRRDKDNDNARQPHPARQG